MGPPPEPPPAAAPDLEALLLTHGGGLRGAVRSILGRRDEVAEVLQDAVLKAVQAMARGDRPDDPVGWLFVIAMNTARDHRRRRQRQRPAALPLDELSPMQQPHHHAEASAALEQRETLDAARDAIHALKENEREVFLLRTSAGLSFPAVAATLDIPIGTAKTRMRSALQRLRESLRDHAPWTPAAPSTAPSKNNHHRGSTSMNRPHDHDSGRGVDELRQELLELLFDCHPDPESLRKRIEAEPEVRALYEEARAWPRR